MSLVEDNLRAVTDTFVRIAVPPGECGTRDKTVNTAKRFARTLMVCVGGSEGGRRGKVFFWESVVTQLVKKVEVTDEEGVRVSV